LAAVAMAIALLAGALPLSILVFGPQGHLHWAGRGSRGWEREFYERYFGITPAKSAASVLDAYSTGAGLFYQRLVGGAADSPIAKDRGSADQWIGGVGLGYIWLAA